MKTVTRYDVGELRASINEDGYLEDCPVVGRIGIQVYQIPGGATRRELRLPEEVFNTDSLASFKGKPITIGHPGEVNAKNAKLHQVGTIMSAGEQDGDHVKAPIIIHADEAIEKAKQKTHKQLSLGYRLDLDETPGVWKGQAYDAIQRNIRINHLAIVPKARAGDVATLNLDGDEIITFDDDIKIPTLGLNMTKIRLDSGQEYEVHEDVQAAFTAKSQQLEEKETQISTLNKKIGEISVERDALKLDAAKARNDLQEAETKLLSKMKARSELENIANRYSVKCDGLNDEVIKRVVIAKLNPEMTLDNRDESYIDAAFDMLTSQTSPMSIQRKIALGSLMNGDSSGSRAKSAREEFLKRQRGEA